MLLPFRGCFTPVCLLASVFATVVCQALDANLKISSQCKASLLEAFEDEEINSCLNFSGSSNLVKAFSNSGGKDISNIVVAYMAIVRTLNTA